MNDIPPLAAPCGGPSLSELRQFDAGELPGDVASTIRTHVDSCRECEAVLRDFAAERSAVRLALPFAKLEARAFAPERPGFFRRWRYLLATLIPVAGALGFLILPHGTPEIRSKGGCSVGFVVRTADGVRDGFDGARLAAGDTIRLKYGSAGKAYILIVGVDSDGEVFPYVTAGDRSMPADPHGTFAPNSVTLDSDTRPERIFAFCSDEPIAVDELKPLARDAVRAAGGQIQAVSRLPEKGLPVKAEQDSALINKVAR